MVKTTDFRFRLAKPALEDLVRDSDVAECYTWRDYLDTDYKMVPVQKFEYAPLSKIFHHLKPGLKVEVPNHDYSQFTAAIGGVFWVATVVKVSGYKVLLRYEGYKSSEPSYDFWSNFASSELHPVGWCAHYGKPLVPPKHIQEREEDWKSFLVKRLTGARTLPQDWGNKVQQAVKDCCRFHAGHRLELIDRVHSDRVRPAIIKRVIGRRLHLLISQEDLPPKGQKTGESATDEEGANEDEEESVDDWCDCGSPLIFPVGWAARVGYGLHANQKYKDHCKRIVEADPKGTGESNVYDKCDATPNLFDPAPKILRDKVNGDDSEKKIANSLLKWETGMKLECMDPLDMTSISVATIAGVLPGGFLKIHFDGSDADDTVVLHKDSPYLFPIAYCETNSIQLKPPKGFAENKRFVWSTYLAQTQSVAAPSPLFDTDDYENGFEVGSKLEAVDMMEPKLICPATVVDKKGGRLLRIRFDGWDDTYDQWTDFRSPDLHPAGWSEMMGYKLESPNKGQMHQQQQQQAQQNAQKRAKPGQPPSKLRKTDY